MSSGIWPVPEDEAEDVWGMQTVESAHAAVTSGAGNAAALAVLAAARRRSTAFGSSVNSQSFATLPSPSTPFSPSQSTSSLPPAAPRTLIDDYLRQKLILEHHVGIIRRHSRRHLSLPQWAASRGMKGLLSRVVVHTKNATWFWLLVKCYVLRADFISGYRPPKSNSADRSGSRDGSAKAGRRKTVRPEIPVSPADADGDFFENLVRYRDQLVDYLKSDDPADLRSATKRSLAASAASAPHLKLSPRVIFQRQMMLRRKSDLLNVHPEDIQGTNAELVCGIAKKRNDLRLDDDGQPVDHEDLQRELVMISQYLASKLFLPKDDREVLTGEEKRERAKLYGLQVRDGLYVPSALPHLEHKSNNDTRKGAASSLPPSNMPTGRRMFEESKRKSLFESTVLESSAFPLHSSVGRSDSSATFRYPAQRITSPTRQLAPRTVSCDFSHMKMRNLYEVLLRMPRNVDQCSMPIVKESDEELVEIEEADTVAKRKERLKEEQRQLLLHTFSEANTIQLVEAKGEKYAFEVNKRPVLVVEDDEFEMLANMNLSSATAHVSFSVLRQGDTQKPRNQIVEMMRRDITLIKYAQHGALQRILRGREPMYLKVKPCSMLLLNDNRFGDESPISAPSVAHRPGDDVAQADDYKLQVRCWESADRGGFAAASLLLPRRFADISCVVFLDLSRNQMKSFPAQLLKLLPHLHTFLFDGNLIETYAQIFALAGLNPRLAGDASSRLNPTKTRAQEAEIQYRRGDMSPLQRSLVCFSLAENPVSTKPNAKPNYQRHLLLAFPLLRHMDHVTVTAEDRLEAFTAQQIETIVGLS